MNRSKCSREKRKSTGYVKSRTKKRKNVFNPKTAETDDINFSTPAKKFKNQKDIIVPRDVSIEYKILNFMTVFASISEFVKCESCNGKVSFKTDSQRGLGFKIIIMCDKCANRCVNSSPLIGHSYEINRRFIFVMRVLGLGLKDCAKFCGLMDMSPFLQHTSYDSIVKSIHGCVKIVSEKLFQCAATEEKKYSEQQNNSAGLTVSGDGTWKKRGFTSLYGVTSLIGYYSGKILDVLAKSSNCKECEIWNKKEGTAEFEEWQESHQNNCCANHEGSSEKMQVDAVVEMFKRSEEKHNVQYKNYIGDGDSKTYTAILKAAPYGKNEVAKKECIEHVQKRMGTRLRECVKNVETVDKNCETRQQKILQEKGKLTANLIDKLTVYYGLAIRRNCDSVENMRNAIMATYKHYCSTNENPQHENCPLGKDSWCCWQRAAAENELQSFEHDYQPFPTEVAEALLPIYEDLSSDELLERCVGGFTQNNNESYNQLIWKISPKIIPSDFYIVEMAAFIASCIFNEGSKSLLYIMDALGIYLGPNSHLYAEKEDATRISITEKRARENTRKGGMLQRQHQIELLEAAIGMED